MTYRSQKIRRNVMEQVVPLSTSIMYAKAYGIYFTGVGLALLSNPKQFRNWYESLLDESRRVLFGGTIALLIGSFIIATHHKIASDWTMIITLIGYWGVGSGAGSLITGNYIKLFRPMIDSPDLMYRASGVFWAALGIFLATKGFA